MDLSLSDNLAIVTGEGAARSAAGGGGASPLPVAGEQRSGSEPAGVSRLYDLATLAGELEALTGWRILETMVRVYLA